MCMIHIYKYFQRNITMVYILFNNLIFSVNNMVVVVQSHLTLCDPWTVACQAPLFMGFSRQEYWSGLPCPPPKDLPNPRIKPRSPTLQANSLPSEPPGKQSPGLRGIHFLASLGFPGLIKLYLQSELTILQCLLSFGVAHFCCLCAHQFLAGQPTSVLGLATLQGSDRKTLPGLSSNTPASRA